MFSKAVWLWSKRKSFTSANPLARIVVIISKLQLMNLMGLYCFKLFASATLWIKTIEAWLSLDKSSSCL